MSNSILKNNFLTLQLNTRGAELTSVTDTAAGNEYLWNADPDYWNRHSPILFPIVGSLVDKTYSFQGKKYSMPQHGFARDMEFTISKQSEDEIWFSLEATEETLKAYPFLFQLEVGYRLQEREITVTWRVINKDLNTMYFSIGGHPAFNCPFNKFEAQSDYFLSFDTINPIHYQHIHENGLLIRKHRKGHNILTTDHGIIPIDAQMFHCGALIIEDNQCHSVSLLNPGKSPYVTVTFDAPLFGLWSPAQKNAPFVCIEPWYGRCDADDFHGTLEEREWSNSLESGKAFEAAYTIEIFNTI